MTSKLFNLWQLTCWAHLAIESLRPNTEDLTASASARAWSGEWRPILESDRFCKWHNKHVVILGSEAHRFLQVFVAGCCSFWWQEPGGYFENSLLGRRWQVYVFLLNPVWRSTVRFVGSLTAGREQQAFAQLLAKKMFLSFHCGGNFVHEIATLTVSEKRWMTSFVNFWRMAGTEEIALGGYCY